MAQGAKKVRRLSGEDNVTKQSVGVPLNPVDVAVAIKQLQDTVNELIKRVNDHVSQASHSQTGQVSGTAVAATNLFVNADQ